MARTSPLNELHAAAGASFLMYPDPLPALAPTPGATVDAPHAIAVVETFGRLEVEYAALRQVAVVLDQPHRGVLRVTGADRVSFLNNMVTQELLGSSPLTAGGVREAFWLSRKGKVEADLRLAEFAGDGGGLMLMDVDAHRAAWVAASLGSFVFSEDVAITDVTDAWQRLGVHGPRAADVVARAAGVANTVADTAGQDGLDLRGPVTIAGTPVYAFELGWAGERGLELFVPVAGAEAVWRAVVAAGSEPTGWLAMNTARIEAGTAMWGIDFGVDHVPAETGQLDRRVSFTKGCYLGQEVVARMQTRLRDGGGLKQRLVSIKVGGNGLFDDDGLARQPVGGAQLLHEGNPVGVVTSSTISPRLGGVPVGFAMVREKHAAPGSVLDVAADGVMLRAVVG